MKQPEMSSKNVCTMKPHVVELITEHNNDYKENDTTKKEAWERA